MALHGTGRSAPLTLPAMPAAPETPVRCESPSADRAAPARGAETAGALGTRLTGTGPEITGGPGRPPMEPASSAGLLALAAGIAAGAGQVPLRGLAVGGVSDGGHTAAAGCPTPVGLGAVGLGAVGGAHADREYVRPDRMIPRARLLAALVARTVS
ncbi:M20/M25/M40 family metallo-hydrolase [Streptomyces sp. NPDC003691]